MQWKNEIKVAKWGTPKKYLKKTQLKYLFGSCYHSLIVIRFILAQSDHINWRLLHLYIKLMVDRRLELLISKYGLFQFHVFNHLLHTKIIQILYIDAHRKRGEGKGKYRTPPPANFQILVNKNAIKPEIGGPLWQFFLKALTPTKGFWQTLQVPPPLDFQPVCASMIL